MREVVRGKQLISLAVFTLTMVGLLSITAWAQVNTGTILGTVQDATGVVLPGAEVVATHIDQGRSRTAISDDEGRYRFPQFEYGQL